MNKTLAGGPSSRLSELGIVLPAPPTPLGAYVEASDTGNLLFLSGTLPVVNRKLAMAGRLGENLSLKEGQEAAREGAEGPPAPLGRRGRPLRGPLGLSARP